MNMRDCPALHLDTNQSEKKFVVKNDMGVYEHERLSNITLRHKLE